MVLKAYMRRMRCRSERKKILRQVLDKKAADDTPASRARQAVRTQSANQECRHNIGSQGRGAETCRAAEQETGRFSGV